MAQGTAHLHSRPVRRRSLCLNLRRYVIIGAVTAVQTGPAWWQTLLIALGGGTLTLVGTVIVGFFNRRSNRNAEWFRRVQWAQQLTASEDEDTRVAGYRVLDYLSRSRLAYKDDQSLLEQLAQDRALDLLSTADKTTVDETDYVLDNDSNEEEAAGHGSIE